MIKKDNFQYFSIKSYVLVSIRIAEAIQIDIHNI